MPHHRQARLVGACGVHVLVELCGRKFGPFGSDDNEVGLALLVGLPYEPDQVLRVRLELGYQDRLGSSRDRAQLQSSGEATLSTYHHQPFHPFFFEPLSGGLLSLGSLELLGALGAQKCSAPPDYAPEFTSVYGGDSSLQKPFVATLHLHGLPA